jgi:histidine triad (HIT) family protein
MPPYRPIPQKGSEGVKDAFHRRVGCGENPGNPIILKLWSQIWSDIMEQCLFCGIVAGKIPAKKVYEDDYAIGFLDISPRNPGHTLVIPKKHFETLLDMPEKDAGRLFESVQKVAVMVKNGMNSQGLSIGQSNGQAAGQVVRHVHVHVIPRFMNEGPVGLEGILPSKKIDDISMDKIAQSIKSAHIQQPAKEHHEKPATEKKGRKDDISFEF